MITLGTIAGGIGLFLLGMHLMTDGLKAMAGDALKNLLSKFTGGIFSSILTGTTITALIQSSSAATFMTIGFVSAGLLTFGQSVGVIIGANLGSTSTGWIVSAIGFQVNMSALALPLIGGGVLLKLFSKDRFAPHGLALAGFGLLFLGIDVLQGGVSGFVDTFNFGQFDDSRWWLPYLLILIGIAMTVVLQSSSAAVVTTLTAVHMGAIDFHQAAILVIGQNVGTTVKAFIAAIGGTAAAKRTAAAHILFNLLTGLAAFLTLNWLIQAVFYITDLFGIADLAVALAVFHTLFNILGVVLIISIMPWFKALLMRLIPEEEKRHHQYLDPSVAAVGPVAIEASKRALAEVLFSVAEKGHQKLTTGLQNNSKSFELDFTEEEKALEDIQAFLSGVGKGSPAHAKNEYEEQIAAVHAIDHLDRLIKAVKEEGYSAEVVRIQELSREMAAVFEDTMEKLNSGDFTELLINTEKQSLMIAELRREDRKEMFKSTITDNTSIDTAIRTVQTIHWFDRQAYHLWRAVFHLQPRGK
ncbi:Na/Pi symporter [Evansella sp. LMS18]|jgi:phosphate:Na+ symporter|uniref:Na/Pi cotransporter family protein n=1 Tax=Evansella sp. LMS18 TaxID=2924033 RepID=UPI0020D1B3A1|nr:Na/Pi symporter [Evansella sp. LMS18]UTR08888.1 Na/Pi symporter [Evansella sp. LMS18]